MQKAFLDTNIWLRFILQDNNQAQECTQLINQAVTGQFKLFTSSTVVLEINYVLTSVYKVKKAQVTQDLRDIMTKGITQIKTAEIMPALRFYQNTQTKLSLADCFIAKQLPPSTTLITYDRGFTKIKSIKAQTPSQFLKSQNPS